MQDLNIFDEYDKQKLRKAEKLLTEVYEYNYGTPNGQRAEKRLETIIKKLGELIPNRSDESLKIATKR